MGFRLSQLQELSLSILTDIFHVRTVGGFDKRITLPNLRKSIFFNIQKGFMNIDLTNFDTTGAPAIAADSAIEIRDSIHTNPLEVAITGATASLSTWYDILFTRAGTTFTASFVPRGSGTWFSDRHGLYSGNDRVGACVYKDSSGNFINKNIIVVVNRAVEIKAILDPWNMDSNITSAVIHGVTGSKIDDVSIQIINDATSSISNLMAAPTAGDLNSGGYGVGQASTIISLFRVTGGHYDSGSYVSTAASRGSLRFKYRV